MSKVALAVRTAVNRHLAASAGLYPAAAASQALFPIPLNYNSPLCVWFVPCYSPSSGWGAEQHTVGGGARRHREDLDFLLKHL